MRVIAHLNNLRISSRKVALVIDQIRGLDVKDALVILEFNSKKPASIIAKLLKSAIANAENNFDLNRDDLFVSEVVVNEGATLKRWMPRAYGRAYQILKRSSKIRLVLSDKVNMVSNVNN